MVIVEGTERPPERLQRGVKSELVGGGLISVRETGSAQIMVGSFGHVEGENVKGVSGSVRPWVESMRRESVVGRRDGPESEKPSGVVRFEGIEGDGDTLFPALGLETAPPELDPTRG